MGAGDTTVAGDYLTMHYTGWKWSDGSQFDSSWDRSAPFSFVQGQGQVITGWDENLLDLAVGSQVMLGGPGRRRRTRTRASSPGRPSSSSSTSWTPPT